MLPATSHTPSSRQSAPAQSVVGPGIGSAAACNCSGDPIALNFSGSTTSSARSPAASRTSDPAISRLRALSSFELSCIAAARIDSRVNQWSDYRLEDVTDGPQVLAVNV